MMDGDLKKAADMNGNFEYKCVKTEKWPFHPRALIKAWVRC